MQTSYYWLLILTGLLTLVGCNQENASPQAVSDAHTYFPISIEKIPLKLQLALTQSEQAQGLMHRDSMPEDHGMLFLFKYPGPRSFWMRNTKIPLDLAYFDASGRLLEIHPLYPYNENAVRSRSRHVLIVVETNQGWFRRNNVQPGAQIDLKALKKAVSARGHSPDDYSF